MYWYYICKSAGGVHAIFYYMIEQLFWQESFDRKVANMKEKTSENKRISIDFKEIIFLVAAVTEIISNIVNISNFLF